jgi:exodeoxyribonuclease VII large subunit
LRAFQHRKALQLARLGPRLSGRALRQAFDREARAFGEAGRRLDPALRRLLAEAGQHLTLVQQRFDPSLPRLLADRALRLDAQGKLLQSLSYRGVLARGYAIVTDQDGALIRSSGSVAGGQPIGIVFADGDVAAHVDSEFALPPLRQRRKRPKPAIDSDEQQSLF